MPFKLISQSDQRPLDPGEVTHEARIRGKEVTSLQDLFEQMAKTFDFPEWFGNNLDALYDGLTDLDWISASTIILELQDADAICSSEPEAREQFTSLLKKVLNYYHHDLKKFIVIAEPTFLEKIKP